MTSSGIEPRTALTTTPPRAPINTSYFMVITMLVPTRRLKRVQSKYFLVKTPYVEWSYQLGTSSL